MSRALRNRSRAAVFLCWHSIASGGPPFVSVGPERFERQLRTLRQLGFRSGGRLELAALARGEKPKSRLAFLTFDDGFEDMASTAAPLLEAYGFRAISFVLPELLDSGGAFGWPRVEGDRRAYPSVMRSMTWSTAEGMVSRGHELGSHTLTHPWLPSLEGERLHQELLDSRRRVEARIGSCDMLAYPFGAWTPGVARAAAAAGYRYGFTLPFGGQLSVSRLSIPRIPVDHRDGERRFRLKLRASVRGALLSPLKPATRQLLRRPPRHLR